MMNHDEIQATIAEVLEEALGCDEDEIVPTASLTADLGAESIDFLDIVFQLEKAFSTDGAAFKIDQGELFPEGLMDNPEWVQDGTITAAGMTVASAHISPEAAAVMLFGGRWRQDAVKACKARIVPWQRMDEQFCEETGCTESYARLQLAAATKIHVAGLDGAYVTRRGTTCCVLLVHVPGRDEGR